MQKRQKHSAHDSIESLLPLVVAATATTISKWLT